MTMDRSAAHGIMLHHFWDRVRHPAGQGAISGEEFDEMLSFIARDSHILGAPEWMSRAESGDLRSNDICITFDDGLRCQYDVAKPVLDARGITAFWFIYSLPLDGSVERLELYRYFRTVKFETFLAFYEHFRRTVRESEYAGQAEAALRDFRPGEYMSDYPFYTREDRIFRFLRDDVLGLEIYSRMMDRMIQAEEPDWLRVLPPLWMTKDQLKELDRNGHVVGLHSHTHPTSIEKLPDALKREEYVLNHRHLTGVLGHSPVAVGHPCNSYDPFILNLLQSFGVKLGFRADMVLAKTPHSALEYPRVDHAIVLEQLLAAR